MIISISRRTDIPAFYSEWLLNRLKEGFVLVRNPMNYHQVSKVRLTPDVVDCIVFWTKDPRKILPRLDLLDDYKFYFQVTITPYDKSIEKNVTAKKEIIQAFKELSMKLGKNRVIWRYDPILLTEKIDINYHEKHFEILAQKLSKYTDKCIYSFIDLYTKTKRNMRDISIDEINLNDMLLISDKFSKIAKRYDFKLETCSEEIDLAKAGINHGKCIDDALISSIVGQKLIIEKDKNQRDSCGCVKSIDIGAYNTCKHNCLYCYANFSEKSMKTNILKYDPTSPMLIGNLVPEDVIKDRDMESYLKHFK